MEDGESVRAKGEIGGDRGRRWGLCDVPSKIEVARSGRWPGSNINVGPDNCEVDCRKGGLRAIG